MATAALALAGCDGGSERLPPPPASAPHQASLEIVLDPDGGGPREERTARLRCPSPDHEDVCRRVHRLRPSVFRPVPRDAVCTRIYGGPQTARIEGTIGRRRVDARFSREGGCEIARYDAVRFLLELTR